MAIIAQLTRDTISNGQYQMSLELGSSYKLQSLVDEMGGRAQEKISKSHAERQAISACKASGTAESRTINIGSLKIRASSPRVPPLV